MISLPRGVSAARTRSDTHYHTANNAKSMVKHLIFLRKFAVIKPLQSFVALHFATHSSKSFALKLAPGMSFLIYPTPSSLVHLTWPDVDEIRENKTFYRIFSYLRPGRFWNWKMALLFNPPISARRWTVIQPIFFIKGYQNAKFDSKYLLHVFVWKSVKMVRVVLFHHFTQYFCPNIFWKA